MQKKLTAFRIEVNLLNKLKDLAKSNRRTITAQLETIIDAYDENEKAAEEKPAPEPNNAISGDEFAGKRVDQDIIIDLFKRPKEEKRSIIQYLKKNGFIQEEVRGVGTCLIVPKDSDIKRLIKGFEPIEDL